MIIVRVVTVKDNTSPVTMRDNKFDTRKLALDFIRGFGKLSRIDRFGRIYVVTPSKSS